MAQQILRSWGRVLAAPADVVDMPAAAAPFPALPAGSSSLLPFGKGRSYGDSCLNPGGALLRTKNLDHFISFDKDTGILVCEAGVQLADILRVIVPQGWFLPVTPGTRFVTVGGAIANDVHGKNHHRNGAFGCHVRRFELLRSNNERLICSAEENADWFSATIGGIGLTGLITWVELQMQPISGPWMDVETLHFSSLDEFGKLTAESDSRFEYVVAWLDCSDAVGRGIFFRANHSAETEQYKKPLCLSLPVVPPVSFVNNLSIKLFNTLYNKKSDGSSRAHYEPFFYPLDGVGNWNRIYGPKGFYQYQCVIPARHGLAPIQEMLAAVSKNGMSSFLSVLKGFGSKPSPGMMSFPCEGVTLALDFANTGASVQRLFAALDEIVAGVDGRLYPAKDGRMSGALFRAGYPVLEKFSTFVDPAFSSGFWRRVMEGK